MMIKSGSAKLFIWLGDSIPDLSSTTSEPADSVIEPEDQKNPLVINITQSIHEIITDDSVFPSSRKQKGLLINIEVSLLDNLDLFNLGLISQVSSFPKGQRISLSQSTGSSFQNCSVLILPFPIREFSQEWRDSSVFVSDCNLFLEDFSTSYGISEQRSWKILISSTSNSQLSLGLGDWLIPGSSVRFLLQQINTVTPSYFLFEDGSKIILGEF